jgi:hypothetical protein
VSKLSKFLKSLTAYDYFLVFLIILSVMKITNVFVVDGKDAGLLFAGLGVGLFVITTVLYFIFSRLFDKSKTYKNVLISTFIILLVLSHADPDPVRGVVVILLLFVSKFFVKYKGQNVFNPVVFAIAVTTLFSFLVPSIDLPPLDWTGVDIRFPILGMEIPLPVIPLLLALTFNVARVKRHPLAVTFIMASLGLGWALQSFEGSFLSYFISILFIGAAIIVEPKTSPGKFKEQIIYGLSMAFFIVFLALLKVPNAPIIAFLIANLVYFIFKQQKKPANS